MQNNNIQNATVLIVDDDPILLEYIAFALHEAGLNYLACTNGEEALHTFQNNKIDTVLTDVKMPGLSGIDLLEKITMLNQDIPVILMTGFAEVTMAITAIKKGAFDFIVKPYNSEQLVHAVKKAIQFRYLIQKDKEYKQTLENTINAKTQELKEALSMLKNMSIELVDRLTTIAEFRDSKTAFHNQRIGHYAKELSEALSMPTSFVEAITFTSPLHDIGKIGISDTILLKPASLTDDQVKTMKTHTSIGSTILANSAYPYIQLGASIALNHHERWDGTGYPRGLKRDETPMEGRIVMICDMYDALRSRRPYKEPFSHEETMHIITSGNKRTMPEHFDPDIFTTFKKLASTFNEIFNSSQ